MSTDIGDLRGDTVMKQWVATIATCLVLSGCGDSGLNPASWFAGQDEQAETLDDVEIVTISDPRPLIPQVTSVRIERTPGGAIVRATGLPPEQGWHSAALVPRDEGEPTNGVLTYDFRAVPPAAQTRSSTVQSREVTVAHTLSNVSLRSIRTIRVVSAQNVLTARR